MKTTALILILGTLSIGACSLFGGGPLVGRDRRADTISPAAIEQDALTQSGFLNAMAQVKAEILTEIKTTIQGQAGVGNSAVGGNQTILDSKVAMASVIGIVVLSLGMTWLYRRSARIERGVSGMVIRAVEAHRANGAGCVVDSLKATTAKGHPLARALAKRVKEET